MNDRTQVRDLFDGLLSRKGDTRGFEDSESLILSGRQESRDTVEIVMFQESHYGVDFSTTDFDQTQFDTVDELLNFIAANRS